MTPGPLQIIVIVLLIVLLFGRGKISDLMGDVAKGIKSFKKGMQEDLDAGDKAKVIDQTPDKQPEAAANTTAESTDTEAKKA